MCCTKRPLWQQQPDAALGTILLPPSSRRHDPLQLQLQHTSDTLSGAIVSLSKWSAWCLLRLLHGQLPSLCLSVSINSATHARRPKSVFGSFHECVGSQSDFSWNESVKNRPFPTRNHSHALFVQRRLLRLRQVSRPPLTAKFWVRSQVGPCEIRGGQSGRLSCDYWHFAVWLSFHRYIHIFQLSTTDAI